MRPDFWFGLAITLSGLAIIGWSIWGGPWITKFVWLDGDREWVEYYSGNVSHEQLVKGGIYQATHFKLKSRTVMRPPQSVRESLERS